MACRFVASFALALTVVVWSPSVAVRQPASSSAKNAERPEGESVSAKSELLGGRSVSGGAFSADGDWVVVGLSDGGVGVLDASGTKMLFEKASTSASILAIAVSPRGDFIATAEADSTVRIWDNGSWDEIVRLRHTAAVSSVAFSHDGRLVATGARDGMARVWEAEHGGVMRDLQGHERGVETVAWSPAGNRIATGDAAGNLRLYELGLESPITVVAEETGAVSCICFSSDGMMVAGAGADRRVRVWNASDGRELLVLEGHGDRVTALVFEPGGSRIVSGGSAGEVRVWELTRAGAHVDGKSDAASGGESDRESDVKSVVDSAPSPLIGGSQTIRTFEGSVSSLSFDPRGERLAVTTLASEVRVLQWSEVSMEAR